MASCSVKRTCSVTLILSEDEARTVRTILGRVAGGRPEVKAVVDALNLRGIFTDQTDVNKLKGNLTWETEVPF